MKTLLELSLQLKVPLINGLNFSHVMAGDVISIGEGLARGAVDMAAVREGLKDTYTGEINTLKMWCTISALVLRRAF